MLTFAAYNSIPQIITEQRRLTRPAWIRATAIYFAIQVRNLEKKIANSDDPSERLELLAKQQSFNSYLSALNIATDLDDKTLATRVRSFRRN